MIARVGYIAIMQLDYKLMYLCYRIKENAKMETETKIPPCKACIAIYGANNALMADVKIYGGVLSPDIFYLCYDHAINRGYISRIDLLPTSIDVETLPHNLI